MQKFCPVSGTSRFCSLDHAAAFAQVLSLSVSAGQGHLADHGTLQGRAPCRPEASCSSLLTRGILQDRIPCKADAPCKAKAFTGKRRLVVQGALQGRRKLQERARKYCERVLGAGSLHICRSSSMICVCGLQCRLMMFMSLVLLRPYICSPLGCSSPVCKRRAFFCF